MIRYALAFIFLLCAPAYGADRIAVGDSIAVGIAQAAECPAVAKVGVGPKVVLGYIAGTPINEFYGRVVILSSGVSNNKADIGLVQWQIVALKAAHAKVILLGIGTSIDPTGVNNAILAEVAKSAGVPFVWGWKPVHPNYRVLLNTIRQVEFKEYGIFET